MAGFSKRGQLGLIALLAARRVQAEKIRRKLAAEADTPQERKAAADAAEKTKRSGWFR